MWNELKGLLVPVLIWVVGVVLMLAFAFAVPVVSYSFDQWRDRWSTPEQREIKRAEREGYIKRQRQPIEGR